MMLTIRKEQLDAFSMQARRHLEVAAIKHMAEFAPKHSEVIGPEGLERVIQVGFTTANRYGFTDRPSIWLYLELMFWLGSEFDTDPQYPWAAKILTDKASSLSSRTERLYDIAIAYIDAITGNDGEHAIAALRRINERPLDQTIFRSGDSFKDQMLATLHYLYPEKYSYVGENNISHLVDRGLTLGREMGISHASGLGLFVGLMFVFGHKFAADPLYPWIERTLSDRSFDPHNRIDRLRKKVEVYARAALSNLDGQHP